MGRGRIEIRKIENLNSRQVTFSKRRSGLLKKAHELSVLCDAEIAVIIFSNTGKLFEFSSSCMKRILSRYNRGLESSEIPSIENMAEIQDTKEVELLKEEIMRLKTKQARLLGKELSGCNLKDLQHLEQQLNEGLISVKEKKEQILIEQLEQSRILEQQTVLENEALRRLVEELQGSFPLTERSVPSYLEYYPVERKSSAIKEEAVSPEVALHGIIDDDEDSDTTLQLGLPSNGCRKRKAPEAEAASENSASQVGLV